MAKKSVALVIDADIARSSSVAPKPTPQNCRAFLNAVTNNGHDLVMTPELIAEWNKHQSKFARKWHIKMYGRKKVRAVKPEHDQELCQRTEEAGQSIKQRYAIFKDFHLVEAALATDQRIASMDETMRPYYQKQPLTRACRNSGQFCGPTQIKHNLLL